MSFDAAGYHWKAGIYDAQCVNLHRPMLHILIALGCAIAVVQKSNQNAWAPISRDVTQEDESYAQLCPGIAKNKCTSSWSISASIWTAALRLPFPLQRFAVFSTAVLHWRIPPMKWNVSWAALVLYFNFIHQEIQQLHSVVMVRSTDLVARTTIVNESKSAWQPHCDMNDRFDSTPLTLDIIRNTDKWQLFIPWETKWSIQYMWKFANLEERQNIPLLASVTHFGLQQELQLGNQKIFERTWSA
jgi:hypothetical protein